MDDNPSDGEDDHNESGSGAEGEAMDEEEATEEEEQHFDKTLPASHSYMGSGLVVVSGRSVLEAGWMGRVPVAAHTGAVFPGETVPMLVADPHDAATLTQVIQHDKLFGLLCPDESGTMVSGYGVLCEVFEAGVGEGAEGAALTFKARATHRFRLVEPRRPVPMHAFARMRTAEVRVLPEVAPARAPRPPPRPHERTLRAALTPWPHFLYDLFDYARMRELLREYFQSIQLEALPEEPVSLSFWVASNLALCARDRLALFVVDDALLRLHMELRFIAKQQKSVLCCAACGGEVARREHVFAMSSDGVHANYTNLGGYMHDVLTVAQASARLSGRASRQYSWFPGYAWTIAVCADCSTHLGWRFDAVKRNLRPPHFFGLCRNYVQPRDDDDPDGHLTSLNAPP